MKMTTILATSMALALAACGAANEAAEGAEEPLDELATNSAKRQCASVAVMQQVPNESAKAVCDCTVDRLIEQGQYTASTAPTEAQQQAALDACIDSTPMPE